MIQRSVEYCRSNRDWKKKKDSEYYQRHKDEFSAKAKVWRSNNQEKIKADKIRWREENRDAHRAQRRNRKARKRANGGSHTAADVAEILLMQGRKCAYCRARLKGKAYHVDHIIPLAKGGRNDRRNLQILCIQCNLSKSALDPLDFMRLKGKLL
jgi:5-methylcytosine-specific restriction endonuclease McrA